jgi:hypothetical protein
VVTAVLVILILTNLVTLALVITERRRSTATTGVDAETFTAPRPTGLAGKTRRIISVEILNPMELVNNRGRMAGLAGSLAPGLARRVVYDQALKTLRRQLESKHVLADVRLHTLRSVPNAAADAGDARPVASVINAEPVETQPEHSTPEGTDWVESVEVIDLTPDGTDET